MKSSDVFQQESNNEEQDEYKDNCPGNKSCIKHGKASEVEVSLEQNSPKTIILKVQDNGNKIEEKSTKGLGTKLLDECAISWKREKSKDLVITSAEFAFSS